LVSHHSQQERRTAPPRHTRSEASAAYAGEVKRKLGQGMMVGHKNTYDCIKAFSETDFTEDLKKFDVPTLIMHGDDDQVVPIGASAMLSSKLVNGSTLKVYPGLPHGMCSTHKDQINADLLAFIKS
jgi:non-heme chloroperoxidase